MFAVQAEDLTDNGELNRLVKMLRVKVTHLFAP